MGWLTRAMTRAHAGPMNLSQFHRRRAAIQDNVAPGRGEDLLVVEEALREVLMDSGLFLEVEVGHTDDPDRFVIALCQFDPFFSEADITARLEDFWTHRVRHPFWEAHAFLAEADHVELRAATRIGPDGRYVTVHLVAKRGPIPEQRTATR